ncbi:MAG: putative histidine kinase, partial [Acidobacteria bacterium]|nr:putative histidine kinase [Acidobacteriota bacterium]
MSASTHRQSDLAVRRPRTSLSAQLLHDLRSPLNQIIGYSEMLTEEAEGQRREGFVKDLAVIRAGGHRMLAIIEENFTSGTAFLGDDAVAAVVGSDEDGEPGYAPVAARALVAPGLLLVVDDEASNRDVLSRRLKRQGHDVRTAGNGKDGLELARQSAFDLVLLDIMMPDMDGYEVLGRLKADPRLCHIPVIMISALSEVQSVVRCIEAGAEDYLAKPFNPTLLKARIDACLEKKRGRDRESVLFEQLQENYRRLQEVEKLRDDMRNMIVHDLRTPLTAVIMGVEMLERHGALNETQREMMGIAVSGGKTLLGMINDLLHVEKMESGTGELQYDDLSAIALVAGAVEQVASLAADERTGLVIQIPPALCFPGDAKKLSRTLVNLIANAIKFTR